MSNQKCKAKPEIINVNNNNPIFYPFSIKTSKFSGNCNNINDPYAKMCVPDVAKDLNVKVFDLMSRANETKNIKWHETYKCECTLNSTVCNNKQRWNKNKCRCEYKELIDKGAFDKGFVWNPVNYECECNKPCDFSEYLDYENCKCGKKIADKLVEECNETIGEVKLTKIIHTENENENSCKHNSYTMYTVMFLIFFIINVGIGNYFVYYKYTNRNKRNVSKYYDCVYDV